MKKVARRTTIFLLILSFFSHVCYGQEPENLEKSLSASEKMDKLFEFWNRQDQPGFAIAVVKDGQVVYQKVMGLACQEHAVPNTPKSLFNVAELAQPVVGIAVAMLEKQGKFSLDDDIRKYIPEVPAFETPVKVRHLLYQTSGLRDWLSALALMGREKEEITFAQVLKIVKAQKQPLFTPGTRFQDSNTNYDLLAEMIKRITGKQLSEWTWENVFKPLKMTRTQFRDNYREIIENQAFSYDYTRAGYLKGVDNLSVAGSHSLFSTLEDLSKWLLNLASGEVGGKDLIEKMFTPGQLIGGNSSSFGYGLHIGSSRGMRQGYQIGNWASSGAVLNYFPEKKFGFVVLANWDYTSVEEFVQAIIDIYLEPVSAQEKKAAPAKAPKEVKVKPAVLDRYVGNYRLGPGNIFTISRVGNELMLLVPGAKYPLTALSESEFLLTFAEARITFQKNQKGEIYQLVWEQGGQEIIAPRIELVKPTPPQLEEYAGTYYNEELDTRFIVELRGDKIVLIPPGQSDILLVPDEKDHFSSGSQFFPMLIFSRDKQNNVSAFVIDSEQVRDLFFKKI